MISNDEKRAINKALKYLSYRARSVKETKVYLTKKGYSEDIIDGVIKYLRERDYLNDLVYAKMWIEDRKERKLFGRNRIRSELILKGIDSNLIEEELAKLYLEEDEEGKAFKVAEKQLKKYKEFDNSTKKRKLYRYLANRGFNPEVSIKVCERLLVL